MCAMIRQMLPAPLQPPRTRQMRTACMSQTHALTPSVLTVVSSASRCSYHGCKSAACLVCTDCRQFLCAAHDATQHFAHSKHSRVPIAKSATDSASHDELLKQAAAKLRTEVDGQLKQSATDIASVQAILSAEQARHANLRAQQHQLISLSDHETVDFCARAVANDRLQLDMCSDVAALRTEVAELQSRQRIAQAIVLRAVRERDALRKELADLKVKRKELVAATDSSIEKCGTALADMSLALSSTSVFPDGLLSQLTSMQREHFIRLLPDVKPVRRHSAIGLRDPLAPCSAGASHCLLLWLLRLSGKAAPALPR